VLEEGVSILNPGPPGILERRPLYLYTKSVVVWCSETRGCV